MRLIAAPMLGLLSFFQPAQGQTIQEMVGTFSVTPTPNFSGGKLNGCTVEFSALVTDWAYSQGALLRVGGSFGYMEGNRGVGVALKVLVHEIDAKNGTTRPSPPASIYFVTADGLSTTASTPSGSILSDTPGARMVAYPLNDLTSGVILDAIKKDRITIAFARRPGGTDIRVPLDLTVKDTDGNFRRIKDDLNMLPMSQCLMKLLKL